MLGVDGIGWDVTGVSPTGGGRLFRVPRNDSVCHCGGDVGWNGCFCPLMRRGLDYSLAEITMLNPKTPNF